MAMPPGSGQEVSSEAVKVLNTPGATLNMPSEFGPSTRMPADRARATSSRCIAIPASPASPKPALNITMDFTPTATQSSNAAIACSAGTAMIAWSTGAPIARRPG